MGGELGRGGFSLGLTDGLGLAQDAPSVAVAEVFNSPSESPAVAEANLDQEEQSRIRAMAMIAATTGSPMTVRTARKGKAVVALRSVAHTPEFGEALRRADRDEPLTESMSVVEVERADDPTRLDLPKNRPAMLILHDMDPKGPAHRALLENRIWHGQAIPKGVAIVLVEPVGRPALDADPAIASAFWRERP